MENHALRFSRRLLAPVDHETAYGLRQRGLDHDARARTSNSASQRDPHTIFILGAHRVVQWPRVRRQGADAYAGRLPHPRRGHACSEDEGSVVGPLVRQHSPHGPNEARCDPPVRKVTQKPRGARVTGRYLRPLVPRRWPLIVDQPLQQFDGSLSLPK